MAIKDKYYIQRIDHQTAENVVIKCHYAHRRASCVYAFGLFSRNPNQLVGVVIYGNTAAHSLCEEICGYEERHNVYELTRLYIDDGLERNLESFLVGNTLKMLDKEIIVSYSDTGYNHIGVIYQASNFYYTGLSSGGEKDFEEIDDKGNRIHNRHLYKKYGSADNIRKAIDNGANIYIKERSYKHRYVYFNAKGKRKKELLGKLKYPILPYPKAHESVPITSLENIADKKKRGLF